jgi:hypothetical protein
MFRNKNPLFIIPPKKKNLFMKKNYLLLAALVLAFAACKKNTDVILQPKEEILPAEITADLTLDAGTSYRLDGQVFVKNNATLTIPAGVTVSVVKKDAAADKGVLVITQGSKLVVNGTVDNPVVFTSDAATKAPGDWGAIIILGKAPTNIGTGHAEGLAVSDDSKYGGTVADDNSGSIKYLRLEYAGGLNPDGEDEWEIEKASGLALHSVGSATSIDNVMVSNSRDDGFQFLGGNVNVSHLVAYNNGDDDYDMDYGYTGNMQFIISYRAGLNSTHAGRANALETYNDAVPTLNAPLTRPIISNMTIIGPEGAETVKTNLNQGVYLRKGTRIVFQNSIIAEYPQGGLMVCPRTRPVLMNNTGSEFKYNLVHSDNVDLTFSFDKGGDPKGYYGVFSDPELRDFALNSTNKNELIVQVADLKLANIYGANGPDLAVTAGSPAEAGSNFDGVNFTSPFFNKVAYRGAVGTSNWAAPSNWAVYK